MKEVVIVIPTLNPEIELMDKFLNDLSKTFENIVIVNDGSKKEYDDYFKKLKKQGYDIFIHAKNYGKGRALKNAYNYILTKYKNVKAIVCGDCDGQHTVEDIKNIAVETLNSKNTYVLGVRNFDDKNVPKRNAFGNKLTSKIFKFFVDLDIRDTQTGLRGITCDEALYNILDINGERFEYETNTLIACKEKTINIKQVDIKTVYLEDSNKKSHFNPIKDSIAIYKTFVKYILSSVSSFVIDIVLFTIFNIFFSIVLSTVISRVISSIYNYNVNNKLVFNGKSKSSIIKYFVLCVLQMFISAYSVNVICMITGINATLIKVIIDLLIFIANFYIQRKFIFGSENEK